MVKRLNSAYPAGRTQLPILESLDGGLVFSQLPILESLDGGLVFSNH